MMKIRKLNLIIIMGVLFIFLIGLTNAVQTEINIQTEDTAILIEYPKIFNFKQNADFHLRFHAFNKTDGTLLTNTTTNCTLNIYSSSGEGLLRVENMSFGASHTIEDCQNCFNHHILGGNFSETGPLSYIIRCKTVNTGGAVSVGVEVTPTGNNIENSEAILYGFIILLIGIFLFFSIMGVSKTSEGSWLIAYICLTYVLLYILIGVCYLLARDFLWTSPIFENILYIIWFIMGIGFLPFVIVLSLYILGKEARAALEEDYIRQGYNREEAKELSKKHKR